MTLEDHATVQRMHLKTAPPIPSKIGSLMKRHYRSLLAVGLIVPASVFVVAAGGFLKGSVDSSADRQPETPARSVRVQEVQGDGAASESSYTGVVRARYESDLAFRVGGKVVSRHVELGERVRTGQPLFELDPEDYELALKAAEADLAAAEAEVEYATAEDARQQQLLPSRATSTGAAEKARADRDMAVAQRDRAVESLALAQNRLTYCTLAANADGVVTELPGRRASS